VRNGAQYNASCGTFSALNPLSEVMLKTHKSRPIRNLTGPLVRCRFRCVIRSLIVVLLGAAGVRGAIVWDGPTTNYTQPGTDPTQPTNQDRLTPNVWLTRASFMGQFNARQESSFSNAVSPADTEWAYGQLTNHASLTYQPWRTWNGTNPPSMVGQDAVVHLISEDIYLSLRYTAWGMIGSGGFSYVRSTPPPPAPSTLAIWAPSTNGLVDLTFTNYPGLVFTVLSATNISLPLASWDALGQAEYSASGLGTYHFTDPLAVTNQPRRFYRLRWP